ncbi:uncharacterized protein [Gossypium hirsutum]|uniref:Uncharacterized protein n=1 Tax=Gossypium hirsutum TaxID=3635 RepID=A0ABM3ASQ9_GOSHI|nr:uncharacterized protein LOC121222049 [Gossypium hirsutum]
MRGLKRRHFAPGALNQNDAVLISFINQLFLSKKKHFIPFSKKTFKNPLKAPPLLPDPDRTPVSHHRDGRRSPVTVSPSAVAEEFQIYFVWFFRLPDPKITNFRQKGINVEVWHKAWRSWRRAGSKSCGGWMLCWRLLKAMLGAAAAFFSA